MNTKTMILVAAVSLLTGCRMGGPPEQAVDCETFSRVTGLLVPSATHVIGIKGPSDAFGDSSLILKFSAHDSDITNLVVRLPASLGTNWTTTTQSDELTVGGPTKFVVPVGALRMSIARQGSGFTISMDTNHNEVFLSLGSW